MIRSYLFVPGSKTNVLEKAIHSNADCVIVDLEDAVEYSQKDQAREVILDFFRNRNVDKPFIIRVNGHSTPFWKKDIETAVLINADGIMLPKPELGNVVETVCNNVTQLLKKYNKDNFEVIPLIESAKGVQNAYEIAKSHRLVSRLAFGSIDFSLDVGCELTRQGLELLYARSKIVIASRCAEIQSPIDSVYSDLNDEEGLRNEAKLSKQIGFKSKLVIHPKQVETVNEVFSPAEADIENAREIVKAFEEAEKKGIASISIRNKMVDYPVYKKAKELLSMKKNLEKRKT